MTEGGGGREDSGGREGSEKGGIGSLLGGKEVGLCNDLGEECLSWGDDKSAKGCLDEVEDAKGEGRLGAPETAVEIDAGNADEGGFDPIMS